MNGSVASFNYFTICDVIYKHFRDGTLHISCDLKPFFKTEYAPEPYLHFPADVETGDGRNSLHFLTTNPGLPLPRQRRGNPLVEGNSYEEVAKKLASNYLSTFGQEPKLRPALNRIKKMCAIGDDAKFGSVLQIDALPWHSSELPSPIKNKLPRLIADCELTRQYWEQLKLYLMDKPVITVDGIGSREGITERSFDSTWFGFKADLIGLDVGRAEFRSVLVKGQKITGAALVGRTHGAVKVMYGVQGHNNLSGATGRKALVSLLRLKA